MSERQQRIQEKAAWKNRLLHSGQTTFWSRMQDGFSQVSAGAGKGRSGIPAAKGAGVALRKNLFQFLFSLGAVSILLFLCFSTSVYAAGITIDLNSGDGTGSVGTLDLLFLTTLLALLPSILIMMTSFTRLIIVLSFLRNALGIQQTPPNQVLVGLALFMTLFIMMPVLTEINEVAYTPLREGTITQEVALDRASVPLKRFMIKQIDGKTLNLFLDLRGGGQETDPGEETPPETEEGTESTGTTIPSQEELMDLGLEVIIPSFIVSELTRAFIIGFFLFIPFLIIDMVVSSTLMSMGMVMLPPSMIALPFKIMIFVLVDGWNLLVSELVNGFF